MNAVEVLKKDHQRISALFAEIDRAVGRAAKKERFALLCEALDAHGYIEEMIFYPTLELWVELREGVNEFLDDHREFAQLLDEVSRLGPDSAEFEIRLRSLRERYERHIAAEEADLFPRIVEMMPGPELEELGHDFIDARREFAESPDGCTSLR